MKLTGPVVPKPLVAVMNIVELPAAFGVPVSRQLMLNVAHDGRLDPEQVGAGFPVTVI